MKKDSAHEAADKMAARTITVDVLSKAIRKARAEGYLQAKRDAQIIASTFSFTDYPVNPSVKFKDMNETAQVTCHATCQNIAIEIQAMKDKNK